MNRFGMAEDNEAMSGSSIADVSKQQRGAGTKAAKAKAHADQRAAGLAKALAAKRAAGAATFDCQPEKPPSERSSGGLAKTARAAAPTSAGPVGLNSIFCCERVVNNSFSFDLNRFGMSEDNEAMSGFWRQRSQRSSGGLAKAAKAKAHADQRAAGLAKASAAKRATGAATFDYQPPPSGGAGDSEEEEDETHTDVAELEAKDMEELTALREAWGGLPARVAAREAYFKFLLSWRWELKAVDRKNAADWFDKDPFFLPRCAGRCIWWTRLCG